MAAKIETTAHICVHTYDECVDAYSLVTPLIGRHDIVVTARCDSPLVGVLHSTTKRGQRRALEDWRQQRAEVSADATERQPEVHALSEQRVETSTDAARQVTLQHGQELRDLRQHNAAIT